MDILQPCDDCPRHCHVVRPDVPTGRPLPGYCHSPLQPMLARAALHFWEEPCISGEKGSGFAKTRKSAATAPGQS